LLGFIEIDKYKEEKKQTYFKVLNAVAHMEIGNSSILMDYWGEMNKITTNLMQNC